jgi:predicted short-subunit dehydrogenase-like oxidoreductase (DUF2520 family)
MRRRGLALEQTVTKFQPVRNIAIIGPGRLGQAMGRLLTASSVPPVFVAARTLPAARRAARFIGQGTPLALFDSRLLKASILLVTTSDSAIAEVGQALSRIGTGKDSWRGKVVLHTCGSLPASVLLPLKTRGATIASMHPYQTVPSPRAGVRNLRGCYWAVEGDRKAVAVAKVLIKRLGGTAFSIRPEAKTLYHLSAFLVGPTVVTLMAKSAELLQQAGVPLKIACPMLRQFVAETARNFGDLGGRRALTGPAVRGDSSTIRRHLATLRNSAPEFVPVYQSLLKAMLRLAKVRDP